MKNLVFGFIVLSLASCSKRKFDKEIWNSNNVDDKMTYEHRDQMLDDLLKTYQLKGKTVYEVRDILGNIDSNNFIKHSNLIRIPVLGIEPKTQKHLILKYNRNYVIDSVFIQEKEYN